MKNLIKCDRCGKLDKMEIIKSSGLYQVRDDWHETDIGDLCFQCWEIYSKFIKSFDKKNE